MSSPRGYDPTSPPAGKPPKRKRGRPAKWNGPASTLTFEIHRELVANLRKGATKRMAAALAGTTEVRLQGWLRRGREAIEQGKRSRYTELVQDVEKAEAEYQMALVEAATVAIGDKTMNDKVIRWRLAVAAPKDFTVPREAPVAAGNGLGPLFELVTPELARSRLDEKLARFLEEHDKEVTAEAEPPPSDDTAEDEDGDSDGS
ncbi:hypothetical protein [Comamonas sp. JC664]|uniref:hypothetical protein n=1 Tax=Comamonas sp. JC664 TaxID=2801917 RepID=UPI00174CD4D9|nr:hypothetical protein [Comamonas sp. JC664]MBL0698948.1 hypothetical protein [Comamonas sp. JC664]GHG79708.1 hypothetical protein GCM10012319_31840 [Comamonas sp. KCTC 72670]